MKSFLTGLILVLVALVFAESVDDGLTAYYEFEGNGSDSSGRDNLIGSLPFSLSCWIRFDPEKVFLDDPPTLLVIMEQSNFWGSNPALYVRYRSNSNTCRFEFFSDLSSHQTVASQEFTIDPNACYLITGGLGMLGRQAARDLAK